MQDKPITHDPKLVTQDFHDGYQQAMEDVAAALADEAVQWLNDDLRGKLGFLLFTQVTCKFQSKFTTDPDDLEAATELEPGRPVPSVADLTEAQAIALKQYRDHHGPGWKPALEQDWMVAGTKCPSCKEVYHFLQQIRNKLGPRWLRDFDASELGA